MNDPAKNPYAASPSEPDVENAAANPPATIKECSKTGTIITFALVQGLLVIAAIMGWMGLSSRDEDVPLFRIDDGESLIFIVIGFGVFIVSSVVAIVIRKTMRSKAIHDFQMSGEEIPTPLSDDTPVGPSGRRLLGASATYTLIGQALMEGPAVINAILMFLESNFLFAIPVVIGLIGIAVQVPTTGRLHQLFDEAKGR